MSTTETDIPKTGGTEGPAKRKTTPAQAAASRLNSRSSRGPRDTSKTRFNGVRHGMCATEHIVMDGEDAEFVRNKTQRYVSEQGAATEAERDTARLAAVALARVNRCLSADEAARDRDVAAVEKGFDDTQEKTLEELIQQLRDQPRTAIIGLRGLSFGILWLLDQLDLLDQDLDIKKSLFPTQRVILIHLVGRQPRDLFIDPVVMQLDLHYLSALHGGQATAEQVAELLEDDRPEDMMYGEFVARLGKLIAGLPDRDTGRTWLKAAIAAARGELTERLDLVQAREERDLLQAAKAAKVSVNDECMRRQRYLRENTNAFNAAFRQLSRLQEMRLKYQGVLGEEAGDAAAAGPETGSGAASEPAREIANRTEAGATEVVGGLEGERASGAALQGAEGARGGALASDREPGSVPGVFSQTAGSGNPRRTVVRNE